MLVCKNHAAAGRLLLLMLLCTVKAAAQTGDSLNIKELERVQVNSSKKRFVAAAVMPAQSLSGETLQRLNSFSVADAIRYFSGVQLKDYGGIGGLKTINVRSMGTQHVGVFLDGVSVGNAQNGTVDLGKYSLDNIESIELYNGHSPELLQPARMFFASSTLLLRTQRPLFAPDEKTKLRATFRTGSFGLVNPSVLWQQKISASASLSFNAEFISAHGRYRFYKREGVFDTTAIRENADITAFRTEAAVFKQLSGNGTAFLKMYYYASSRGLPGAIVENRFYNPQRLSDRNLFVHGSYQKDLSERYMLLLHAKYTSDYTRYKDPAYITIAGPLDNRYRQQEGYFSAAQKYKMTAWWEMGLSTDFAANTLTANLYRFAYPRRFSYINALTNQLQWQRFTAQANLLYAYFDERVADYTAAADRSAVSPTVAVSWKPFEGETLHLRSFYKESLRMPTFNDLYYTLIGNTFLKPEYTRQYDLGFTWITAHASFLEQFSLQADVYYNKVKDKIVAMPAANLFRWMMLNMGSVHIKGIEINAGFVKKAAPGLVWNAGFNYTYQQAVNKTTGASSYGHQIPNMPVHSGTAHGSLLWKCWAFNYSFIYTGERYVLPENIAKNYAPAWYTTDLGVVYERKAHPRSWKTGCEVNNVFNQYYDVVLNFPMPGRNYRLFFTITL